MSDITLSCGKKLLLLRDCFPDWRKAESISSECLIAEDKYPDFELYPTTDILSAELYVDDTKIGYFDQDNGSLKFTSVKDNKKIFGNEKEDFRPFLTYFGYIVLRVEIMREDGQSKTLYTKYINVCSRDANNNDNAEQIMKELDKYDGSIIGDWAFNKYPQEQKNVKYSFWYGSFRPKSGRHIDAYIELLKNIMKIYRQNFYFFKMNAYHKIEYHKKIISYDKIRRCAQNDFQWLMQNADSFAPVSQNVGISYQNKNYLPNNILGDEQYKNFDIYENQVVVNFLNTVLRNCCEIYDSMKKENRPEILRKHINPSGTYSFSILTLNNSKLENWSGQLDKIKRELQILFMQYSKLLPLRQTAIIRIMPHTTKVFMEVRYYREIFDAVRQWFDFGEFSIDRINAMLKIKTMDTLYEYYCLYRMLKMLLEKNWELTKSDRDSNNEICDVYIFAKGDKKLTLYYQPKIFGHKFNDNGITLFRTKRNYNGKERYEDKNKCYWEPDFVIKIQDESDSRYAILDAKYAETESIRNIILPECADKYVNQISEKYNPFAVRIMALLQGKYAENIGFAEWKDPQLTDLGKEYYKGPIIGYIPVVVGSDINILYDRLVQAFAVKPVKNV